MKAPTINSNNCFPTVFNNDFREIFNEEHVYTEFVEAGGRGSCKSTFISFVIPLLMIKNPTYNAVVLRKFENTLKDSVYNQLKWSINKLGLSDLFKFTKSPLQIVYIPTGQTIFFRGSDDPLKIKSIKPENGYTAITWFEEWAEFQPSDYETIKLSTMRGGDKFFIFCSYNPPASARSWVNEETRKPKAGRLVHKTTFKTVPREWLGDAFINEAQLMAQRNPRAYKNIFLGEPTGTGRNVFENIELREITDEEIERFEWIYSGLDWGYFPDSFRYVLFSYNAKTEELFIYDELSLLKHGNAQASEALKNHLIKNKRDLSLRITADSAEPKSIADFREFGWNLRGAIKRVGGGKSSLDTGFKWLQTRARIVVDPRRCPLTADELSLYEYEIDKRTGEVMSGYPQNQPDHSLAALRYGTEEIWINRGM